MNLAKSKILLVEDDINLGSLLKEYLIAKNYETDLRNNGEEGYKAFMKNPYDICILDVMMPIKDGFTLAREIRELNNDMPIIFLTAKNLQEDIFKGFTAGADDYITKPFSMQELLFRIEAILKRTKHGNAQAEHANYTIGNFLFDTNKRILIKGDDEIKLTTKESDLLKLLCINANGVLERNFALKSIWIDDNYFNARSMDVYITKLRKYLKDETGVEIMNVHGKGFKLILPENN